MDNQELTPEGGWADAGGMRIAPPPPSQQGAVFRLMSGISARFGRRQVPNIFLVFNKNPRLFWAWLVLASRFMPYGRLRDADREKIILRTAWMTRSRYEWGQHVELGLKAGLSDDDIVRASRGPDAFDDPRDRALVAACDEMLADRCISNATWEQLRKYYDEKLLIEIVVLIGHYEMLAGFLNSTGVALEPDIEKVLQDFHRRVAG